MTLENFRMALRSLAGAKLRSFLTMLGIIIGVAAVVAIVAIGQGVKDSVTSQVSSLGAGTMIISTDQAGGNGRGSFTSSLGASTLTQGDVDALRQNTQVKAVASVSLVSGLVKRGGTISSGDTIEATDPDFATILNMKLASGRFLSNTDADANVAVIGAAVKSNLFGTGGAVGQTITIGDIPFTVIGVGASSASTSALGDGGQDLAVEIPTATGAKIAGSGLSIIEIIAEASNPTAIDATVSGIKARIKQDHGGQEDFKIMTQKELLSTFNTILNLLTTFIGAIASISLLVGGIGIMNIMLVSVTERTREIGIRKALGATSTTVLGQFLIEAVVLTLIGGAIGLVVAYGMARLGGRLAGITPGFTVGSIVLAFGISAAIGIIFGIAPAIKAARLRPIDALRYE